MARVLLKCFLLAVLLGGAPAAHAQVFSNKEVGKKNQALADSLKQSHWPYVLPIWGAKATARGFNLPLPAGVSVQYFGQRSDLVIDNLQVGFNNGPLHNLDGIVRFDKARAISDGVSLRPDIWLLPFLNLYGIFGMSKASTDVGYSLWLPDSTGNDQQVVSLASKVDFTATTFGFGVTPTIGVGGGWMAFDMNFTWTDVPQLAQPAVAFVFDPRVGKSFRFNSNPDQNLNVWVGGFRVKLNTGTSGSVALGDVLPIGTWQGSVDQGMQKVAQLDQEVEAWWNGLSQAQQENPVNRAKYEAAKSALARAAGVLDAADAAVANASSSTVQYSLDKRPADMWNFIVGGQFQMSKKLMVRAEAGFLSSRTQFLGGLQYRFGF